MEAKKYIREKIRMFDSLRDNSIYRGKHSCDGVPCSDCPMLDASRKCIDGTKESVDIVEKWSKEHPVKTIMDDFLEKYPKVKMDKDGTPVVCAEDLGYKINCFDNRRDCIKCWDTPMEVE